MKPIRQLSILVAAMMATIPACECIVTDKGSGQSSYAVAYRRATDKGRPLAVLLTASWCPPCQRFKKTALPKLKQDGVFDCVSLAVVDIDQNPNIASKVANGKRGVPLFVIFYRLEESSTWQRKTVTAVTEASVRRAIKDVSAEIRR